MAVFDLESYATVQERIAQFYQDFPDGSIRSFMVVRDGPEMIFEARVYRTPEEAAMGVYTSGWAREIEGKTPVNRTSHLENAESSAVGRSLANFGDATDSRRPSRSEMIKVVRVREEHEQLLQYIRTAGARVSPEVEVEIGGRTRNLRDYVRENWPTIKEQFRVARRVVDAIEEATGMHFAEEREAA
ncbi:hypothetical protein BH23GEM3_BH23GEM3_05550 [soil metagenome]